MSGRRQVLVALVFGLLGLPTGAVSGAACSPRTAASLGPTQQTLGDLTATARANPNGCNYVRAIEFPVVTNARFLSSFGAPRDGGARWHTGVDIEAPAMTPVVAAADGIVTTVHRDEGECCWVAITHHDNWVSMYVHLTNDVPGGPDNAWAGIRPDLEEGDPIKAGQVLGWVGNSGNAEGGTPHLHFELRNPSGEPIDPYPSLRAVFENAPAALAAPPAGVEADGVIAIGRPEFAGPFADDDDIAGAETVFTDLLVAGVPVFCDEWGIRVCPTEPVTDRDVLGWVQRLYPDRRVVSWAGGQSTGCADGCPPRPLTWAEVAAIVGTAMADRPPSPGEEYRVYERMTGACGLERLPATPSRLEAAAAFHRLLGPAPGAPCTAVR